MNTTESNQNVASIKAQEYREQYRSKVNQYMAMQLSVVRGLHSVLQVLFLMCVIFACIMFIVALYYTFVWIFTGALAKLDDAWVKFGLSMSLLVFPLGLDSMLTRVFPAAIFPVSWYRSNRPIPFITGIGAFFAGLGITCAGAPGVVHFFNLASQAVREIF